MKIKIRKRRGVISRGLAWEMRCPMHPFWPAYRASQLACIRAAEAHFRAAHSDHD